jgi:hypothetical protein
MISSTGGHDLLLTDSLDNRNIKCNRGSSSGMRFTVGSLIMYIGIWKDALKRDSSVWRDLTNCPGNLKKELRDESFKPVIHEKRNICM